MFLQEHGNSEQCAGIAVRIDKRKTAWPFFALRLPIGFRAVRRNSQASPIKEKRVKRFSPPDFLLRFRAMRRNPHASPIKEKRVSVFQLQTSYKIASSVRSGYIRVSRTTAFCIAKCAVVVQGNDTASLPCVAGILKRLR